VIVDGSTVAYSDVFDKGDRWATKDWGVKALQDPTDVAMTAARAVFGEVIIVLIIVYVTLFPILFSCYYELQLCRIHCYSPLYITNLAVQLGCFPRI